MELRISYILAVIAGLALAVYQGVENTVHQSSHAVVADDGVSIWPDDNDADSSVGREQIAAEIVKLLEDSYVSSVADETENVLVEEAGDVAVEMGSVDKMENLEEQFSSQFSDSQWMAEMYQALQEAGADSTSSTGISHDLVECKEQICKVVLMYSDKGLIEDYVDNLMITFKGKQAVSINFDEDIDLDGNTVVEMYVMR